MTTERASRAQPVPLPMDVADGSTGQVVTVSGRIDAWSVGPVRDLLHRVIDTGTGDVVLMLGEAEIGDASALGMLVGAHHRARRAGRRFIVSKTSPRTARLLRVSRLDRVLVGASGSASHPVAPLTAYLRT